MQYQQSTWRSVFKTVLLNFYNSMLFIYLLALALGMILGLAITQ